MLAQFVSNLVKLVCLTSSKDLVLKTTGKNPALFGAGFFLLVVMFYPKIETGSKISLLPIYLK
jgi:uncharacterized membrane protein